MINIKILELTSDIVFKSFMMNENTKEYTAKLINLITGIPEKEIIENGIFTNVELPIRNKKEKMYKADIIITVIKNIINIEMNREYYNGLYVKNNAYKSRIYSEQFEKGEDYINVKKIISINIDNFSKFKGNKFLYKFLPMEIDTKEIEDENIETYHLDLEYLRKKCYNKEKLNELERLSKIFITEDYKELEKLGRGSIVMEKATRTLEEISKDEKIIGLYDAEAVERKVWNTKIKYAEEEGMKRGVEKGIEQGINCEKINIAKKLLQNNIDIDIIKISTGLSDEEIENLK